MAPRPSPGAQPPSRSVAVLAPGPGDALYALKFTKGPHRWWFRYPAGGEEAVIAEVRRIIREDDADLDWLDAALITHELRRRRRGPGRAVV